MIGSLDRRVDAYIARAPAFARPILKHIRETVHSACPAAEETMRRGRPHFVCGRMVCAMAAYKAYWSFRVVQGPRFPRLTKISDLPRSVLRPMIKKAAKI